MATRWSACQGRQIGSGARWILLVALLTGAVTMAACAGSTRRGTAIDATSTASPPGASASDGGSALENLVSLRTSPERGPVGTSFTLQGDGLPRSAKFDVVWGSVDGSYQTNFNNNTVEYVDRVFTPVQRPLGQASSDASGHFDASFSAPEDFGNTHDIYVLIGGKPVAKGGFLIDKQVQLSPPDGPVGTPISVTITGLGWKPFESTAALMYDNHYTGFVSATTTRGTARFTVRAAGGLGPHSIEFYCASSALPYLNCEQSPVAFLGTQRFVFNVTADNGAPPSSVDWPDGQAVAANPPARTTVGTAEISAGVTGTVSPSSGPVHSKATVQAKGLVPGAAVDVTWVSVAGSRVQGGWDLGETPLGHVTAGSDGSLTAPIEVPATLGGWHAIRLRVGDHAVAEVPYFVERSLVSVPREVKAGETFTIHLQGVGWTELDNAFAVTYDNAYTGYACGFASNGDVTMQLVATGTPGTHLIDLYPMIYDNGHGKYPWQYNIPQLTFARDHPALGLGYRLPAFHLAIEVVP